MADILPQQQHEDSISALESSSGKAAAPAIEMVPNPAFSFPMKPLTPSVSNEHSDAPRRPMSMFLQPATLSTTAHKRNASALPTFSFNATDTSGRLEDTPPRTPDENALGSATFAKKGHRRGGSEYVGGDSRFGVDNAITSSPTKTDAPPLPEPTPSPAGRRHVHRRSVAVSSHDLSQIMSAGDKSTAFNNTTTVMPTLTPSPIFSSTAMQAMDHDQSRESQPGDSPERSSSRPRVEFVEQVEIIPRPLSTISSGTESSASTMIGHHSVSNSISSMLSMGSPAPASHARGPSVGQADVGSFVEPRARHRSSIEVSRRVEKEGEWLRRSSTQEQPSPTIPSESGSAAQITIEEPHERKRQKRLSNGYGFHRRRSEPLISSTPSEFSRLSALSLQDMLMRDTERPATSEAAVEKRSSGYKLKQWALSKLQRRHSRPQASVIETSDVRPESADSVDVPGKVSMARDVVAETDLDAVFSQPIEDLSTSPTHMTFDAPSPLLTSSRSSVIDLDDASPLVDLDEALEPLRTPPLPGASHRRHMHSDRGTSAFLHRRAESEPVLMAFNYSRMGSASQKSMEDVFEEEEEDTQAAEQSGMGISMVDADRSAFDPANPESLRQRRAARKSDRPVTSYTASTSQLFVPAPERPASLVDDVIMEESKPASEVVEIVEAHEEPRSSSMEKSSESSDASTVLGAPVLPYTEQGLSPSTHHSSSFSSPNLHRRQGSSDASRAGTSASSIADTRTTSSCTTGEPGHEIRMSVDDVPSLTSSQSTMMSTGHADPSRPHEAIPRLVDTEQLAAKRRKRASIQSLSQLVSETFGSKGKTHDDSRPQTATQTTTTTKKEHRLKKLMFWRSKQNLRQAAADAVV